MNVGKLYLIKQYYWYLYPSKETAAALHHPAIHDAPAVALAAAYWSKQYKCNVTFVSPNDIFCLLEQEGKFRKVLTTNGELGWIIYSENVEWAKGTIEEVKQ